MEFTQEQKDIINYHGGSMKIDAGAGSGKTTTLANHVNTVLKTKKAKEEEIMFITFTRFAADEIRSKIAKILGQRHRILTGTFHKTMFTLLRMASIEPPVPEKLYDARMQEMVNFFLEKLRLRDERLVKVLRKYKRLIVDEFQDLDEDQFEFIVEFKKIQPELIVIAIGDLAQNIYRFRGTSNEFLRTRLQKEVDSFLKSFTLTTNFRSSKSILRMVNLVFKSEINNQHILPMYAPESAMEGIKPKYYEYARNPGKGIGEYEDLVAQTLLPVITRAKETGKSMVLLFPVIKCSSFQIIIGLIKEYSKNNGLSIDYHQIAKEDETCATIEFKYKPRDKESPIQISTFHASKGLEWDIVAIVNLDDSIYNLRENDEDSEAHYAEKTNLTYVGLTRPIEELYIFCNANNEGRHRNLARLGDAIHKVMDVTTWGEDEIEERESKMKPIGVKDLIRKLPQHPDLFKRIKKTSESILKSGKDGIPMMFPEIYNEMKKRNREIAFGTYIDWKIKQIVCKGDCTSSQDYICRLLNIMKDCNWRSSLCHLEDTLVNAKAKLNVTLNIYDIKINDPIEQFVAAARDVSQYCKRRGKAIKGLGSMYYSIEKKIIQSYNKEEKSIIDEYILSQSRDFFVRGTLSEIQALDLPDNSYQGMPEDYELFINSNTLLLESNIRISLHRIGATSENLSGDISLETESLICGAIDLYSEELGGIITEIKCSDKTKAIDLRDSGDCKNLLQLLSYVAMGRHGCIEVPANWAMLVNPLTGAHEVYDLSSWSFEQSEEFMNCLEELRRRTI
uniref:DNA 3'-5' helicase n=1 Tax=viral metagenome TaxID=1070528 RepID=A0A6C0D6X0_9ZZZZ